MRALQRNISSQYYYRMLQTQKKDIVKREMEELTAEYQNKKLEFIENKANYIWYVTHEKSDDELVVFHAKEQYNGAYAG